MGYVTYEMGLSGLSPQVIPQNRGHHRPDICLAWVTKSIVLDHRAEKAYLQVIDDIQNVNPWLNGMIERLSDSHLWTCASCPKRSMNQRQDRQIRRGRTNEDLFAELSGKIDRLGFKIPDSQQYEAKVAKCQDFINDGESYELCLTGETLMTRPKTRSPTRLPADEDEQSYKARPLAGSLFCKRSRDPSAWDIYKTLRSRQPAPFGSFLRLGGATLLSSSPERFLRHDTEGNCSMRPMKGTVRKSKQVSTLAEAEKLLHTPKEIAENLMIVDLVRHDLHGICGSGKVTVPELLKVEEYATVFAMVTNVSAQLDQERLARGLKLDRKPFHGLHVLGSVLPPGSMTGAPKKRSCEILSKLENRERGLYSGVVGFFDVTGQADWSVTIRAMWTWDDEIMSSTDPEVEETEVWRIGAGGAVTSLSNEEGERQEMLTKLRGPLGAFRDMA